MFTPFFLGKNKGCGMNNLNCSGNNYKYIMGGIISG
jgi:hypothetical protein